MKPMLVRWLQSGNLIRKGIAENRSKGDEDIMEYHEAISYQMCGLVKIVGEASEVAKVVASSPAQEQESEREEMEIVLPDDDEDYPEDEVWLS